MVALLRGVYRWIFDKCRSCGTSLEYRLRNNSQIYKTCPKCNPDTRPKPRLLWKG